MNLALRGIDSTNVKWNNEGSFLNDAHKDGSYTPPRIIRLMSSIHKNQTTTGKETPQKTGIKALAARYARKTYGRLSRRYF